MLDYNIVWFEDSEDFVKGSESEIRAYLNGLGFDLNLIYQKDDSNWKKLFEESDIDLALVDQNLREGKKGEKIITAIANNEMYTDVVFYSQNAPFPAGTSGFLEGVFYTSRKELLNKTKKIIDLTIKKNLDICNIRGQFIAEAIDASTRMEEIISRIFKLEGEQLSFYYDSMIYEEFLNDMNKYKIIVEFLRQKLVFLNAEVAKTNKKPETDTLKKQAEDIKKILREFSEKIIPLRNELAHASKTPGKKNTLTVKDRENHCLAEKVYDNDKCKEIRLLFIKHAENLENLKRFIVENT